MINKKLNPFKLCVLQNFPYIEADFDALTNYQLLCKVVEFLNKTIDAQNEVITEFGQLHNAFIELKNFIDGYLEQALQTDVNAKLDEMAEDGTLESLIGQYIDEYIERSFLTVSDMKYENIDADVKCRTMGYYSVNDGGGASYIIRDTQPDGYYELMNNGKYAELIIENTLNIKQIGCKNDGNYDNLSLLERAITIASINNHDIYVPNGTYRISTSLSIPSKINIKGSNMNSSILKFDNGGLIYNNVSFCSLEDIMLKGTNRLNYGVLLSGNSTHMITLKNVMIYDFNTGINSTASFLWDCTFNDIRVGECDNGLKCTSGFSLLFNNFYIDRCKTVMNLSAVKCSKFIGSNFSLITNGFTMGGNCNIDFDSCNFECDQQFTTSHMFNLTSKMIRFSNCNFIMNCASTVHVFRLYDNMESIVFENCSYTKKTENLMPDANFWDKANFKSTKAGGILFLTPDEIPRPEGLYSNQYAYYHDAGNGIPIKFYGTTNPPVTLIKGTLLLQHDTSKLCLYNGTNIIDVQTGNVII